MEQLVFLIFIGLIGLIRLLMQAAEKKRNEQAARGESAPARRETAAPAPRAPATSEEERMRRFMEALGVPTAPPQQKSPARTVTPKTTREPKRKIHPLDPFPAPRVDVTPPPIVTPSVIVPSPVIAPAAEMARPVERTASVARQSAIFEVADVGWQTDEAIASSASTTFASEGVMKSEQSWGTRLARPEGARDAVVLREIFGLPRSLQPLDLI